MIKTYIMIRIVFFIFLVSITGKTYGQYPGHIYEVAKGLNEFDYRTENNGLVLSKNFKFFTTKIFF